MKKILIILTFIALGAGSAYAQGYASFHYDVSFPLAATSDAASKTSFRGVGFDYRKGVSTNIGVGFSLGWHVFYERKTGVFTEGTISLHGVQYSYVNAIPMHVNVGYYFNDEADTMRPFIGLGVGTTFIERRVDMGIYTSQIDTWQFSLQPEVGLLYEVASGVSALAAVKYTNGFSNSDLDSQAYVSLNFGVAWKL